MEHRGLRSTGVEGCPYRHAVDHAAPGGVEMATCGLLEAFLGASEGAWCGVDRGVCESCCRSSPPSAREPNPVVASLLYARASRLAASLPPGGEADWLESIASMARERLDIVYTEPLAWPHSAAGPGVRPLAELIPPPSARHGRRVRDWALGVTTSPRVQPVLGDCLESLTRAGWERPHLFIDAAVRIPEPFERLPCTFRDERIGAWPNYYLALTELLLRHPRADAYLVVQDDALFDHREPLAPYLGAVCWPGWTPCLVSLYCSDADTAAEPGWHPSDGPVRSGPLALAFPRELVQAFLTDRDVFAHRWDPDEETAKAIGGVISSWADRQGVPVWLPTPSLVQHIGDTSTLWPLARAKGSRRARWFAGGDP